MKPRFFLILVVILLWGCAQSLLPQRVAPLFYNLSQEYKPLGPSFSCGKSEAPMLRVFNFQALHPFGERQMVVEVPPVGIQLSANHQWIAPPPVLIRDVLVRDFSSDGKFKVVEAEFVGSGPLYGISGRVEKFSWVKLERERFRAELEVTLQLWSENFRRVVLSKRYSYKSSEEKENLPEVFASSMSRLVERLSYDFRRDLCIALFGKDAASF